MLSLILLHILNLIKKNGMKKTINNLFANMRKITALGIIFLAVISCKSSKESTAIDEMEEKREVDGNVCPCDKEMVLWEKQPFPQGEVWLFRNYIPRDFFGLEDTELGAFISYCSVNDEAFLYLPESYMGILGQGFICNFPDFAKEWLNHENGLRVYIEGVMYYYDFPAFGMVATFGYELTNLKRR